MVEIETQRIEHPSQADMGQVFWDFLRRNPRSPQSGNGTDRGTGTFDDRLASQNLIAARYVAGKEQRQTSVLTKHTRVPV